MARSISCLKSRGFSSAPEYARYAKLKMMLTVPATRPRQEAFVVRLDEAHRARRSRRLARAQVLGDVLMKFTRFFPENVDLADHLRPLPSGRRAFVEGDVIFVQVFGRADGVDQ